MSPRVKKKKGAKTKERPSKRSMSRKSKSNKNDRSPASAATSTARRIKEEALTKPLVWVGDHPARLFETSEDGRHCTIVWETRLDKFHLVDASKVQTNLSSRRHRRTSKTEADTAMSPNVDYAEASSSSSSSSLSLSALLSPPSSPSSSSSIDVEVKSALKATPRVARKKAALAAKLASPSALSAAKGDDSVISLSSSSSEALPMIHYQNKSSVKKGRRNGDSKYDAHTYATPEQQKQTPQEIRRRGRQSNSQQRDSPSDHKNSNKQHAPKKSPTTPTVRKSTQSARSSGGSPASDIIDVDDVSESTIDNQSEDNEEEKEKHGSHNDEPFDDTDQSNKKQSPRRFKQTARKSVVAAPTTTTPTTTSSRRGRGRPRKTTPSTPSTTTKASPQVLPTPAGRDDHGDRPLKRNRVESTSDRSSGTGGGGNDDEHCNTKESTATQQSTTSKDVGGGGGAQSSPTCEVVDMTLDDEEEEEENKPVENDKQNTDNDEESTSEESGSGGESTSNRTSNRSSDDNGRQTDNGGGNIDDNGNDVDNMDDDGDDDSSIEFLGTAQSAPTTPTETTNTTTPQQQPIRTSPRLQKKLDKQQQEQEQQQQQEQQSPRSDPPRRSSPRSKKDSLRSSPVINNNDTDGTTKTTKIAEKNTGDKQSFGLMATSKKATITGPEASAAADAAADAASRTHYEESIALYNSLFSPAVPESPSEDPSNPTLSPMVATEVAPAAEQKQHNFVDMTTAMVPIVLEDEQEEEEQQMKDIMAVNKKGKKRVDKAAMAEPDNVLEPANGEIVATPSVPTRPSYTYNSSAYVQNLAEICYTVLNDRRWTVPHNDTVSAISSSSSSKNNKRRQQVRPLFRWEDQETLSIAKALSRRYIRKKKQENEQQQQYLNTPLSYAQQSKRTVSQCSCLLCRPQQIDGFERRHQREKKAPSTPESRRINNTRKNIVMDDEKKESNHEDATPPPSAQAVTSPRPKRGTKDQHAFSADSHMENNDKTVVDDDKSDHEEEEEDDRSIYLYCRLFYRKGPWFRIDDIYQKYYAPDKKMPIPSTPFTLNPGNTSNTANGVAAGTNNTNTTIDEETIEKHVNALSHLFSDLYILHSRGFIRSFENEEECARTVGVTLLFAEERKLVLNQLGGGGGVARRTPAAIRKKNGEEVENEILKQLLSQKTLNFAPKSADGKRPGRLLPVTKHVDSILFDQLAEFLVQASSEKSYVPKDIMRHFSSLVQNKVKDIMKKTWLSSRALKPFTCFRLENQPMRMLQRIVRLYLCASLGPGQMRLGDGDGSSWRSLLDVTKKDGCRHPPLMNWVPPPRADTFHHVVYPGLLHRFGKVSQYFTEAFKPCPISDTPDDQNDPSLEQVYMSKESFLAWETCVELRANVDYLFNLKEELRRQNQRNQSSGKNPDKVLYDSESVDALGILTREGKCTVLKQFFRRSDLPQGWIVGTLEEMEKCTEFFDEDIDRIIAMIGVMAIQVLLLRHKIVTDGEVKLMSNRPWLRHMWWDGCLAYILWDIVPLFEKKKLYLHAISALETLLTGDSINLREKSTASTLLIPTTWNATNLSSVLLSRRTKGKALERLVIDYKHVYTLAAKDKIDPTLRNRASKIQNQALQVYCQAAVEHAGKTSSATFAALRNLARRLQQPLSKTLQTVNCVERDLLKLRSENEYPEEQESKYSLNKYSDWEPTIDYAVANAITKEERGPGGRCSFVGFEDSYVGSASLNVEQLAMEFYNTGRLPETSDNDCEVKGGWEGWHDEGGHIRALFRILTPPSILGMDWGSSCPKCVDVGSEAVTIHLSPYQGAPFDLHVGYELHPIPVHPERDVPRSSLYYRRRIRIELFLNKLAQLGDQDVSDLVYDSIQARQDYIQSRKLKDPTQERDLQRVRTLSLLAAGLGGPQLSCIFRCFLFDYRHYSGGLPDLTLVRAVYENTSELVSLNEWVGEEFSVDKKAELQAAFLADDEFLGCSKVGDSAAGNGGRNRGRSASVSRQNFTTEATDRVDIIIPERLILIHNSKKVKVESMLVEVKSSNDRLDARQEDWLNILDRHGNSRVCKFGAKPTFRAFKDKSQL